MDEKNVNVNIYLTTKDSKPLSDVELEKVLELRSRWTVDEQSEIELNEIVQLFNNVYSRFSSTYYDENKGTYKGLFSQQENYEESEFLKTALEFNNIMHKRFGEKAGIFYEVMGEAKEDSVNGSAYYDEDDLIRLIKEKGGNDNEIKEMLYLLYKFGYGFRIKMDRKFFLENSNQEEAPQEPKPAPVPTIQEHPRIEKVIGNDKVTYPLDTVSTNLFKAIATIGTLMKLKAESNEQSSKGKEANIYVQLNYVDVEQLKGVSIVGVGEQLTQYDKRVWVAVSNLAYLGYDEVTPRQVYHAMGNKGVPNKTGYEKVLNSIKKMRLATVYVDNTEEIEILKNKYPLYRRQTWYLLPVELDEKATINGRLTTAIKLLEIPMLFMFAIERKQVTTFSAEILCTELSQSEDTLKIEDYCLRRIAKMMNNPKVKRVILLETLYDQCDIQTRLQKSRCRKKVDTVLSKFKNEGIVTRYTIDDRSKKITLTVPVEKPKN